MMKKILLVLVVLLAINSVFAQSGNIYYAEDLLLNLKIGSGFSLQGSSGSDIDYARAKFYFYPESSINQDVIITTTEPTAELKQDYMEFYWDNPIVNRDYTYELESDIRTYNKLDQVKSKIRFPITNLDPEIREYLQKTEKIDVDDDIIEQASLLAEGEDDLYKVVFNLASWTKENIDYSLTTATADASQSASWVLENRYGVCDELTNLFIAMCRSLGIPARFVSGISYSNSDLFQNSWGLHGWAEVYFPGHGWVSFDPTYGQHGYLDATHIKLRDSLDSDKSSTKFEWQANNVQLVPKEMDIDVEILQQGDQNEKYIDINLNSYRNSVDFDSYNLIKVDLKNLKNHYISTELRLGKTKEVSIINDETLYVLLKPYEEKTVYWVVKVEEDLSRKFVYTFPYEVYDSYGYSEEDSFKAEYRDTYYNYGEIYSILDNLLEEEQKTYSKNIDLSCSTPSSAFVNESFQVTCKITNKGNIMLKDVNVCLETTCQRETIGISQTKNVDFNYKLQRIGENELSITAKNKDISKNIRKTVIIEDKPLIEIEILDQPKILEYGPNFDISFEIKKHSMSNPKNMRLSFIFNNKETIWDIEELEANQRFTVTLDKNMLNPSDNNYKIIANYYDRHNRTYIEEHQEFLDIIEPSQLDKIIMWLSKVSRDIAYFFENLF